MKKYIFGIVSLLFFITNVNAASVSLSLTCDSSALPSSVASCTMYATPTGFSLRGVQGKYSFNAGSYNEFVPDVNFENKVNSDIAVKGFSLITGTEIDSKIKLGVLKINMPASGNAVFSINGINATDSLYNTYTGSSISKTIRGKSSDNTLKSLTISTGTLSPAFSSSIYNYSATVDSDSISVSAIANNTYADIVSGTGETKLDFGENIINVVVKAETGDAKTYKLTITRKDQRDTTNTLKTLNLSKGTLTPEFSSDVVNYKATVEKDVSKITISSTKTSSKSSYVSGFGPREVNLSFGNNKIEVKVKSESGAVRVYTITVTREDDRSDNNYLKSLTVDYGNLVFDKDTLEYAVVLEYSISKTTITGVAEDEKATIKGNGSKTLKVGVNSFNIVVTAENGTTKTYVIKITRKNKVITNPSNLNLSTLSIEGFPIDFKPEITEYYITLNDETSLNIGFTTEDATSSAIINGNNNLINDSVISIIVTGNDGTTKEYKINIIKEKVTPLPEDPIKEEEVNLTSMLIGICALLAIITMIIVFIVVWIRRKKQEDI